MCGKLVISLSLALVLGATGTVSAELIGHWPLEEGAGSQAADVTGRGHNGAIDGATWVSPGWNGEGACLQFDGANDLVAVPHADDLRFGANSAYTIVAWINMTIRPGHWSGIVTKGRDTANWYGIWVNDANRWVFGHQPNNQIGSPVEPGVWVHVAMVYNNANKKIYLNGKLDSETTASASGDNTADLWFGAAKGVTEFTPARIDDIRIYNHALSLAEIKKLVPPKLRAYDPTPADGAIGVTLPLLQWTKGETAVLHDVYLGTNPDLTEADTVSSRQSSTMYYHGSTLQSGTTYFWRIDEVEADMVTVHTGNVWSFATMPLTAWAPAPVDGAQQILLTPTLEWIPGQNTVRHHLYFGDSVDAVEGGAPETDMGEVTAGETTFRIAAPLDLDTTYYWRVDGIALNGAVQTGEIWSFTTLAPGPGGAIRQWWSDVSGTDLATLRNSEGFPDNPTGTERVPLMEGPVDWADNYGSRLHGWLYPTVSGDYTFWISSDDNGELWLSSDDNPANAQLIASVATWTASREWNKEATQMSVPQSLAAGKAYYIEAIMNEGTGGDNIAVAWQGPGVPFTVIGGDVVGPTAVYPLRAFAPSPASGATETIQNPVLSWSAGEKASRHAVYLGNDPEAVAAADTSSADIFCGQQAGTTYDAGELEWGKTYYWRIDEINTGDPESPWKGTLWSFTTADFIPVDDFEIYTDDEGSRIYETWIDGYADTSSGSIVGHLNAPFAEQTIVHGGKQSMPMDYNNVDMPYYSQAERTWDTPQDWTTNGVDALTLYVQGQMGNDAAVLYVALQDSAGKSSAVDYDDDTAVESGTWLRWSIPLSRFSGVNPARIKKMYIGVGDRTQSTPGGLGRIYIDDLRITKTGP